METASRCRERAQDCCLKAAMAEDALVADSWLQLARSWLVLANEAAAREAEASIATRPN